MCYKEYHLQRRVQSFVTKNITSNGRVQIYLTKNITSTGFVTKYCISLLVDIDTVDIATHANQLQLELVK